MRDYLYNITVKTLLLFQAISIGVDPLYLMFPAAITSSFAFMLPVATPPNAIIFSYGYIKVIDMVSVGLQLQYDPPHDKTNKVACAPSEDSDQPGHPPSLIRAFVLR